jgi:membrane-associated phospholipid phosphatase
MAAPRLRPAEWLAVAYFVYVASLTPFCPAAPTARESVLKAWLLATAVACIWIWLSRLRSAYAGVARDWGPLLVTLTAYRQMDWFTPAVADHRFDAAFIGWDRWLLDHGLRAGIESAGRLVPGILEACYLTVYAVAPVALWILVRHGRRDTMGRWWLAYLAGTLGAYALLPWFPSQPPRTAFAGQDLPRVTTWLRQLNLSILGGYGIHSSVFPSAHVSSAFSAAWGLRAVVPERPALSRWMAIYGCGVAVATVYGRYHYAADVVAGFVVSFAAVVALRLSPATGTYVQCV